MNTLSGEITRSVPVPSTPKLSTLGLFRQVPPAGLRQIEKRMIERRYEPGETIFLQDEPADLVWLVQEGFVKELGQTSDGQNLIFCMVGPGELFGIESLADGTYHCQGVAQTAATVFSFNRADYWYFLGKFPALSTALTASLSASLRRSMDMQVFDRERVEKRLLHILLVLMEQFGRTIPLTRRELAELAGTTVETAIRTFSRLQEEGMIATARGKIIVRDVPQIQEKMEMDQPRRSGSPERVAQGRPLAAFLGRRHPAGKFRE